MALKFNITNNDGDVSSVTVFKQGGGMAAATPEHPNFKRIIEAIDPNSDVSLSDDAILALFDIGKAVVGKFQYLSDRVTVEAGRKIFFDGDPIDPVIEEAILTMYLAGHENFQVLVNFLDKVMQNPNEHSRNQLYVWLNRKSFAFAPDGDIIGYKSVYGRDRGWLSSHSGTARVNGELFQNRQIPTRPGAVVEMPRSVVDWNPNSGCSVGLHVGTWGYARTFSGDTKLRVKVNPRDVVSVPTNGHEEKMRVCRYRILDEVPRSWLDNHESKDDMIFVPSDLRTISLGAVERQAVKLKTTTVKKAPVTVGNTGDKIERPNRIKAIIAQADAAVAKEAAKEAAAAPAKKASAKKSGATTTAKSAAPAKKKPVAKKSAPAKKAAPVKKAATKVTPAAAQAAVKKGVKQGGAAPVKTGAPTHYEDFKAADFEKEKAPTLVWLAKEWAIEGRPSKKADLIPMLVAEAAKRRRRRSILRTATK